MTEREPAFLALDSRDGQFGVFVEEDEPTLYFYAYEFDPNPEGGKVVGAIMLPRWRTDTLQDDLHLAWESTGRYAAVFARGHLLAAFDFHQTPPDELGGRLLDGRIRVVPEGIAKLFGPVP